MDTLVDIRDLKAYYRVFLYGLDREVRAVRRNRDPAG